MIPTYSLFFLRIHVSGQVVKTRLMRTKYFAEAKDKGLGPVKQFKHPPPPVIYYWPYQGGSSVVVHHSCACVYLWYASVWNHKKQVRNRGISSW